MQIKHWFVVRNRTWVTLGRVDCHCHTTYCIYTPVLLEWVRIYTVPNLFMPFMVSCGNPAYHNLKFIVQWYTVYDMSLSVRNLHAYVRYLFWLVVSTISPSRKATSKELIPYFTFYLVPYPPMFHWPRWCLSRLFACLRHAHLRVLALSYVV